VLDRRRGRSDDVGVGFKARTKATDAADAALLQRLRERFLWDGGIHERRMFGGVAFLIRGNMCCGILRGDLMVRVLPEEFEEALAEPHAQPMAITGQPLRGFVQVAPKGYEDPADFARWVARGERVARSLPPK
jgi:hypothetical protein